MLSIYTTFSTLGLNIILISYQEYLIYSYFSYLWLLTLY